MDCLIILMERKILDDSQRDKNDEDKFRVLSYFGQIQFQSDIYSIRNVACFLRHNNKAEILSLPDVTFEVTFALY